MGEFLLIGSFLQKWQSREAEEKQCDEYRTDDSVVVHARSRVEGMAASDEDAPPEQELSCSVKTYKTSFTSCETNQFQDRETKYRPFAYRSNLDASNNSIVLRRTTSRCSRCLALNICSWKWDSGLDEECLMVDFSQ